MAKKRVGKKVAFKDRKTGLVIFGIIHIIIGAFCALFMLFTIVGAIAVRGLGESVVPALNIGQMILAVLLYLLLAVWFVWMGIGSILTRKWARALILITSWLWLIGGVIGFIFIFLFMPDIFGPMAMGEAIPKEIAVVVQSILMGFMAVILVIIPGAFVLFYSSRHVKATCERRDPRMRWTDKAPLPVITLSSLLGVVAISMPFLAFYRWTMPFFGVVLSGRPGAVVVLVYAVLFAYAAWGTFKLQITAWWCGLILTVASAASMGITFSRVSLLEFYEQMNMPKESLEIMKELGIFHDTTTYLTFWGIMSIGFLGFLIYTKRHFAGST
jgi:MFS family permease